MEEASEMESSESNLVYPKIQSIYSRISVKTEPLDFEENDFEPMEINDYASSVYYMPIPNKIILGSKPPTQVPSEPAPSTSWDGTFQCDDCSELFPTQSELDAHKTTHSFLIARPTSRASKNTSLSFSDDSSLDSAKRPVRVKVRKMDAVPMIRKALLSMKPVSDDDMFLCKHCDVSFPNEIALIKHTYELIPEKVFSCSLCNESFAKKSELKAHGLEVHTSKGLQQNGGLLHCHICNVYLKHLSILKRHLLKQHNTTEYSVKHVKFTGKCAHCSWVSSNNLQHNKHILKRHSKIYSKKVKKIKVEHSNEPLKKPKPTAKTTIAKHLSAENAPIPNQILFKCNKCRIHFVTSTTAYEHSKRCVLAKGDWKCHECRRTFTHLERNIHARQHKVSEKFKIHTVTNTMPSKVLCKCPKCQLHLNEPEFWEHWESCSSQTGIECSTCKLEFHKNSLKKHRAGHIEQNYSRADYIIVEYVQTSSNKFVKDRKAQNILYYCAFCKSHQSICKVGYWHRSGSCRKTISQRMCPVCGLSFSSKALPTHMVYSHQKKKLSLEDFTFVRMQDNEVTPPLMPEFCKCAKCEVRFGSPAKVNSHKCETVESKQCVKCHLSFEPAIFKIHLGFHVYDAPVARVNYFACGCGYGFNAYDALVNHAQEHYTASHTTKVVPCKVCKLKYSDDHPKHDSNFRILKFDHETLLTVDWLNGFDSVPKSEADEILAQSVYSSIRNVRLELLKEGPGDRCLYKCLQCDVCVDSEAVATHASDTCAKSKKRFHCESCSVVFDNSDALCSHTDVHVIYGDDITFKEVAFNHARDKKLNEVLRSGKKESLKFRKCSNCELLVKKNDYESHMRAHNEALKRVVKYGAVTYHHPVGAEKMYKVYECRKCGSSMMKMKNVSKHKCVFDKSSLVECPQCSQWLRASKRSRHFAIHAALPKFTTGNITVVEFEIDSEARKKRRYSEDSDFLTNSDVTPRVAKRPSRADAVDSEIEEGFTKNLVTHDEAASLPETPSMMHKNRLFQCRGCYMCFIHKRALLAHVLKCTARPEALRCTACDFTFHPSLEAFHAELHERVEDETMENYLHVHYISTKGIRLSNESCWIYQCRPCDVYYMTQKALDGHLYSDHKFNLELAACELCDRKFTAVSRGKHIKIHHQKNRSIEDLNYQAVDVKVVGGEIALAKVKPSEDGSIQATAITHEIEKPLDTVKKEPIEEETADQNSKESSVREIKAKNDSVQDNVLFKCTVCSIHFINKRTLQCHVQNGEHVTKSITCEACGLIFSKYTATKHLAWHHKKLKLNLEDFIIQTVSGEVVDPSATNTNEVSTNLYAEATVIEKNAAQRYECARCRVQYTDKTEFDRHVKIHEDINTTNSDCSGLRFGNARRYDTQNLNKSDPVIVNSSLTKGSYVEALRNEKTNKSNPKKIKLYQCKDCKTCVRKTNTLSHECCSDIGKKRCIQCSLAFSRSDFTRHRRLHERFKLSRRNFSIVVFGRAAASNRIYKCVRCVTHFATLIALEWHMSVRKHATKKVKCQQCALDFGKASINRHVFIHHTKLKLATEQFDIVNVGLGETVANVTAVSKSMMDDNHVKMFRCVECEVFFLHQESYYKHMYRHERLDDTEFIQCKICALQFLTESLAEHMKSHKEKTFSLDKVVVESFNPFIGKVTNTYVAEDGLNSKVSTTTPFDDVQTVLRVEQMSTVDSTSDESRLEPVQA